MTVIDRWTHGASGYTHRGCRCDRCRAGVAAAEARRRANRPALPEGDPRHGTTGGYSNHRCRCESCTGAMAAYNRDYRARRATS